MNETSNSYCPSRCINNVFLSANTGQGIEIVTDKKQIEESLTKLMSEIRMMEQAKRAKAENLKKLRDLSEEEQNSESLKNQTELSLQLNNLEASLNQKLNEVACLQFKSEASKKN